MGIEILITEDGIVSNKHVPGTWTYPDGRKYVGEYKDGNRWSWALYHKDGNIQIKFMNGEPIEQ